MTQTHKTNRTPKAWAALALSLALISSSRSDVLLTSFEADADLLPETATNTPITRSSAYATQGISSMSTGIATDAWNWSSKSYDGTAYTNWKANKRLLIDMTRVTTTAGGNMELVIAINGPQGWQQKQLVNWEWQNAGLATSKTLEWDYSALAAAAPAPTGPSDYFQLNIMARSGYSGQTVYLDNVRFAGDPPPPPALAAYTFDTVLQGFGPTTGAVPVAWSSSFGGSMAMPGNSPGWKAHATKGFGTTTSAALRLAECVTRGGVLRYDLIAPAGTLGGFFVQTVLQHSTGSWNQHDQNLQAGAVISLPGGMELVRVTIPTSVYPNLVATGSYTMHLSWDSATAHTIYLDNVTITPNNSDSAKLSFDSDEQGFSAQGVNSTVQWAGNGVSTENPGGWEWGAKKTFTATDTDPEGAAVFAKLALAATQGGVLRFKVTNPYLVNRQASFSGMDVAVGLSGDPWQQRTALFIPAGDFTEGADPEADPPVLANWAPGNYTRTASVRLYPSTSTATDGIKLVDGSPSYELWIGTSANHVDFAGLLFDDFEVVVYGEPQILHAPPAPKNTADAMIGRVLSNAEGVGTFSAAGLPPGVTIDATTGLVTGTPTANGSYSVVYTATMGITSVDSTAVPWVVSGFVDPKPVITGLTYDGTQTVITWSDTGTTPVKVWRSTSLTSGSWEEISTNDTDGTHTDTAPPPGKAFYRVEMP
jgi:hypothetical protein